MKKALSSARLWLSRCLLVSACVCLSCFAETLLAQSIQVTGKVTTDKGEEMPFVHIYVKGTSVGTTSDETGRYTISAPGDAVLVYSFLGYVSLEQNVNNRNVINVVLKEDASTLDAAVVTGYQVQSRKTVSSAVATVTAKDLERLPATSFDLMLQGQAAGLNVQNFTGVPGGKPIMTIRGNTALMGSDNFDGTQAYSNPLIVMDGIQLSDDEIRNLNPTGMSNFLAALNPSDIESVTILKDAAAAALYGSRAANGVLVITTKKGKIGKPKISFNGRVSVTQRPQKVETVIGTEERHRKMDLAYLYGSPSNLKNLGLILTDSLNPAFNNAVDWQDLFYRTGIEQDYNLSVSGATESVNYRVSGSFLNQDGVVNNTGFRRFTLMSNTQVQITDHILMRNRVSGSINKQNLGRADERGSNSMRGFGISPLNMPSSLFYLSDVDYNALMNPDEYQRNDRNNVNLDAILEFEIKFLRSFMYKINGVYAYMNNKNDFASPSFVNESEKASAWASYNQTSRYQFFQQLNWYKTFQEKHSINAFVAQEFSHRRNEGLNTGGLGVPSNDIQVVSGIPSGAREGSSSLSKYSRLSFFGSINYDFKQKYIAAVNFRADASSRFGVDNRWGYFPSASAAWNISEESFVKNRFKFLDFWKLRASYGIVGDEGTIGDADRYNAYSVGNAGYHSSNPAPVTTYDGITVVTPNFGRGIVSRSLKWQQAKKLNIGMDFDLFNFRISGTVDVFRDLSERQMLDMVTPSSSGYNYYISNVAGVMNRGIEFTLSGKVFPSASEWQWTPRFNITYIDNRVTALPGGRDILIQSNWGTTYYSVGKPVNQYYGIIDAGVINSPSDMIVNPYTGLPGNTKWGSQVIGSSKWKDVTGDYKISDEGTENDQTFFGNPNPKVTGALNNTVSWKNWTLQVYCSYIFGRDVFSRTRSRQMYRLFGQPYGGDNGSNTAQISRWFGVSNMPDLNQLNYWRQEGDQAEWPAMNPWAKPTYMWSVNNMGSMFMEPGWYINIRNINLAYTFREKKFLQKLGIASMDVWGAVDNVYIFQQFSGPSAEQVDAQGMDMGDGYPVPRRFSIGLRIEF